MFDGDWTEQANCATVDPELFFPEKGASTRPAKLVCRGCPVKQQCLDEIMATELAGRRSGVWGETSPADRDKIAARQAKEAA
jgi:WhiB family transcriptional regulator, redox-sensing transcriptional regulator